jgi:adenine-specific DNA-methyltransferase
MEHLCESPAMNKIEANDAEAQSADIVADNLAQLQSLFPEAFAEGKVQFDTLRQLLGGAVDEADEKYGLNWHGKRRARQIALTPSTGTLRPCPDESVEWDTTQNLMIEGDNLEVLKLLQKSYSGKVKLIYIDPPYNTGKDFIYPDNFRDSVGSYLELTGQVEGGVKMSANVEASGRFHTDWLNMMYPRLKVARTLLREDGVIFISIDENELDNLIKVCNEIFGEENFVGLIATQLNPRGRHLDRFIARTHEYLCVFARNADSNAVYSVAKDERMASEYRKTDSRGKYRELELRNRNPAFNRITRPNLYYPIYVNPNTGEVSVEPSSIFLVEALPKNSEGHDSCWTWGKEKLKAESGIVLGRKVSDGGWRIYRKDYLLDADGNAATTLPKALWIEKEFNNDVGKKAIQELFDENVFDFPKSPAFIGKIVEIGSGRDDIVLDFFAGSGTTGQAVMTQNVADSGNRRFIAVQLPEPLDEQVKGQEAGAKFCEKLGRAKTIAELTKERLRRSGKKVKTDNAMFSGDTGFRVFKLDKSNIRLWNPSPDNLAESLLAHHEHVLEGRTEADIVYELLLKLGLDLCVPIESRTVAGKTVGAVGGGVLMLCLAEKISAKEVEAVAVGIVSWHKELAPAGDSTVVFRDSAFADDVAKTNMAAILAQNGLENVRSL